MIEGGRISSKQLTLIMISQVIATAVIFLPGISAKEARESAWISPVVAMVLGIVMAVVVVTLTLRHPGKTIVQYAPDIVGRIPGKIIGLLYAWWFLHLSAIVIREFAEFLITAIMVETPIIVFIIFIILVSTYAVNSGLEVVARTNEFLMPLVIGSVVMIVALVTKDMKFNNLLPVLEKGWTPVLRGAYAPTSWMGETVALVMLLPYLNKPREGYKAVIAALIVVCICLVIMAAAGVAVFGAKELGRMEFPIFNLARVIRIAAFLERIDAVVMALWVSGVYMKVTVTYYCGVIATAQALNLRRYQPILLPYAILLGVLTIVLYDNVIELVTSLGKVYPPYAISTFQFGIPLFLLVVSLIRGKGAKQQPDGQQTDRQPKPASTAQKQQRGKFLQGGSRRWRVKR